MFDTARPMRGIYRLDDLAAHVEDDAISAARALVGSAPRAPAAPAVPQQSRPTPPSRASSHISEMRLCVDPVRTTSPAAGRSPHSPRSHHLRWQAPWPSSPSSSPISESCIIASSRRGPRSHVEATRCWKSKHVESTRHAHVVRSYLTPGFFGLCGGSFGMTPPADE